MYTLNSTTTMLRVGTPENIYLPWAGKDSVTGEWSGFGVDLMEELASRTGFRSAYLLDSLYVYNGRKYFQLCILWEFIFIHGNRYSLTGLFWIMKSWQKWYDVFIVTDVSKNITDMTLPVYFISLERALIADFTVPYSAIEAVVFMKRPQVGQLWKNYEEVKFWLLNLDLHRSSVHLPAAAVRQCVGVGVRRPGGGGGLAPAAPLRQRGQDHDSVTLLLDGVLLPAGTGLRGYSQVV